MKYKDYEITPQYLAGSDFTINDNTGKATNRKPTKKDIDFYRTEHLKLVSSYLIL